MFTAIVKPFGCIRDRTNNRILKYFFLVIYANICWKHEYIFCTFTYTNNGNIITTMYSPVNLNRFPNDYLPMQ